MEETRRRDLRRTPPPAGAIPTRSPNSDEMKRSGATASFTRAKSGGERPEFALPDLAPLRGHDLACWCKVTEACPRGRSAGASKQVKRPEQHETDSAADALFCGRLFEVGREPTLRDYGRDYVVEYFKQHKSTGLLFAAQLKGSRSTPYSADGSFISQSLEKEAADYLARQLELPAFVFHADVIAKKLFWSAIQLDQKVLKSLEKGETQSLTVRIPTANLLPDAMDQFLEELTRSRMEVVRRILLDTKPLNFVSAMARQPVERAAAVAQDLHIKGFQLELNLAQQRFRNGEVEGAIGDIQKILANSAAYVEIQFNGTMQLGELEAYRLMKSPGQPQALVAHKKLQTAQTLCRIANRQPRYLHLAAQLLRRAAELTVAVQKTNGLLMNWNGHRKRGTDPLWIAVLSLELQDSLLVAHRCYARAMRLAKATANSRYRMIASRPLAEIATWIGTLARVLESCDLREIALQYDRSAVEIIQFSAAIANEHGAVDDLYHALMTARVLERDKDGEIFKWIESIILQWPKDSDNRKNAEYLLQRSKDRLAGKRFEGDIETTHLQIHHNILTSHGIDPTTEPWVTLIALAIKDDDPTRVLIDCEHKVVAAHPAGDPFLVKVGLERANPKLLGCTQYGYALGGRSLDATDEEFKRRHCGTCLVRSPRTAGWTFYDEPKVSS